MNTSWGTKASHSRKRAIRRTKVRWEMLGLQDPTQSLATPSIEDIRRQIISAASQGLSPDTLTRSHAKDSVTQSRAKTTISKSKRGVRS